MANEIEAIATNNYVLATQQAVTHDNSMSGNGTVDSPLGVVPGYNETVLWEGACLTQGGAAVTLAEPASNFEKIEIYVVPNVSTAFNYPQIFTYSGSNTAGAYMCPFMTTAQKGWFSVGLWTITNGTSFDLTYAAQTDNYPNLGWNNAYGGIVKVVGINRIVNN